VKRDTSLQMRNFGKETVGLGMSDTIFGKIIRGDIPSEFLYEDEHCIAINDIRPQAPVHVLVIPKQGIPRLVDAQASDQPCWDT
jgi:Scavenger mRNA decapping enzyme C-term binding